MEAIQSCRPLTGRACNPAAIEFQGQSGRLSCLNLSEEQSAQIAITTDEGDKVTLSSHQHTEATFFTYEHLAYYNSGYDYEEIELADFAMDREIALSIEGELNEQELADIQALLKDLGGMLKSFLVADGAGNGLSGATGDLSRFSTISSFEADFEYRASVRYLNVEADRFGAQASGWPQVADPPLPAETTVPVMAAAPTLLRPEVERFAAKMVQRVDESGMPPRKLLKFLKKFLKSFLKELRANQTIDAEQTRRGESVLDRFADEVRKSTGAVEARASQVLMNLQAVSSRYEPQAELELQPTVSEIV